MNIVAYDDNIKMMRLILESGKIENINQALYIADSTEAVTLLIKHGADVNASMNDYSPLHEAVERNNYDKVKLLIDSNYKLLYHISTNRGE